jgi:hypothetical protein
VKNSENSVQHDLGELEGYKLVAGQSGTGGQYSYGIKIFIKCDHEMSKDERFALYKAQDSIVEAVMKESIRSNPDTHDRAQKERAEIVGLFPSPIYVEEIPNGYCSKSCCSFLPWFVVTTSVGRIKIGWRKSVLHLEWTDSAVAKTAAEIFPNEEAWPGYETTQYDKVIHAHGYKAAEKYIHRILEAA